MLSGAQQARWLRSIWPVLFHDPVLVWQAGKVGSTAITQALAATPDWTPMQIHYLSEDRINSIKRFYERAGGREPLHLQLSALVREMWPRLPPHTPVISAVRDPIARNISAYFETFAMRPFTTGIDLATAHDDDELVDRIVANFLEDYDQQTLFKWFDREVKEVLGLDYTALRFDRDEACATSSTGQFRLLVIRAEDENQTKAEAVRRFLGLERLEIPYGNTGGRKPYSMLYRRVLERIVVPDRILDLVYGHPLCRIFYSKEEIARFRARWSVGRTSLG